MGFTKVFTHNNNSPDKKTIIIGTLWTGEPQLKQLVQSLSEVSKHYNVILKVVAYKDNLEAHMCLWDFFNDNLKADIRVKLDGDMGFDDVHKFLSLIDEFESDKFYIIKVKDYITDTYINGVNLFTKNYPINFQRCSQRFPDKLTGEKTIVNRGGISHCANATHIQIGEFIGHRLKKAIKVRELYSKKDYLKKILQASYKNMYSFYLWVPVLILSFFSSKYKFHSSKCNQDIISKKQHDLQELVISSEFSLT